MDSNNPYQGPSGDPTPEPSVEWRAGEARRVPAAHGWYWLRDAWRITRTNKGLWTLAFFVLVMILMGVNLVSILIPFVGHLAVTVVTPVFMVGLFQLAHRRAGGDEFEFGDLFIGFSRKTGPLLYAGLSQAVLQIVYMAVMFVLALSLFGSDIARLFMNGFATGTDAFNPAAMPGFSQFLALKGLLFALLVMLVLIPYMAALWLQIPLVYFGDRPAFPALLESLKVSFRNGLPLLWYGVVLTLVSLALVLAFGVVGGTIYGVLGSGLISGFLLVVLGLIGVMAGLGLAATCFVSIYMAFRDMFAQNEEA